jgi:hypothetical protein
VPRRFAALLCAALVAVVVASPADASPRLKIGIYEEALTLGSPNVGFAYLTELKPQVLRLNLYWNWVAASRPANPTNPFDPAYNWGAYDLAVQLASASGIEVLLHVISTPPWANGGKKPNYAPTNMADLYNFTLAAARRYSGQARTNPFTGLPELHPAVNKWAAWNEPNLATYLRPTWKRVGGKLQPVGAWTYARICTNVWRAVHAAAAEAVRPVEVACGVTSPYARGGSGISPRRMLLEMKKAGARFDVYAHHAYAWNRKAPPTALPPNRREMVSLGNINDLIRQLTRLYGRSKNVWITEYGYESNPPDRLSGVSLATQAAWMRKAHTIMRRHPRIDMMIWFLVQDEPDRDLGPGFGGWQSGLVTTLGLRKPAFTTFQTLPRP